MIIENTYISTKEAMQTFGLNRVWLFRKDFKIRRMERVEKGRNKVYYNVEDIKREILAYHKKTKRSDASDTSEQNS